MLGKNAHVSRSAANRGRLLAQAGLVVVLAMTALAWWRWSSGEHDAPLQPLDVGSLDANGTTPRATTTTRRNADFDSISGSLLAVSNAYRPPETTDATEVTPIETPRTNGNSDGPVRYLGLIDEGERRLALLSLEGRQRVVAEGDEFAPGLTLLGATPDAATIQDDAGRQRIPLAGRTGPKTAVGALPTVTATPAPGLAGRASQASDTMARRAEAAERMRANREMFERRRAAEQAGTVVEQMGEEEGQR